MSDWTVVRHPDAYGNGVRMRSDSGQVSLEVATGWTVLDAAQWEAFKEEGDRLMAAGAAGEGNGK